MLEVESEEVRKEDSDGEMDSSKDELNLVLVELPVELDRSLMAEAEIAESEVEEASDEC